jgi:lipoate-protein ligase A
LSKWRLLNLGSIDGYTIQAVYEAIASSVGRGLTPNTVVFCYPSHPYVCVGVHQVVELEVDVEYCTSKNIPIIRRQVGGGTVYLDEWQQFYHVIIRSDDPLARLGIEDFFRELLKPVVKFYRSYGLPAMYKPVNDVVINGRKASGNGAAKLHNSMVLIGNVILDFNAEEASKILRVPDIKLRDKLVKSMKEWVTSLKNELGYIPSREEVVERLKESFESELNVDLVESYLTPEELSELDRVRQYISSREWLYGDLLGKEYLMMRYVPGQRVVKIREGHYIVYVDYRSSKTVRLIVELEDGVLRNIIISGDFFIQPINSLPTIEKELTGYKLKELISSGSSLISEVFKRYVLNSSGISPEDIVNALNKVVEVLNTYGIYF